MWYNRRMMNTNEWPRYSEEHFTDYLVQHFMNPHQVATAIFDYFGRFASEQELEGMAYSDVKQIFAQREMMQKVVKQLFGPTLGETIYDHWVAGEHDT